MTRAFTIRNKPCEHFVDTNTPGEIVKDTIGDSCRTCGVTVAYVEVLEA